jgi:4-amino-4-deoxy-L-arabinose transferase-like glycosyltransferase
MAPVGVDPGPKATGLAFVIAAAVLVSPWAGHVDDTDAQLYQVVARHMVQDGRWLDLRYLADAHAEFREHLPFGLWPWAAAIRVAGERALSPLAAAFTLGTLLLVSFLGRRLGGWTMATVAVLALGTTESFIIYGGRPRLDPLLLLLVVASLVPVLAFPPSARRWLLAAGFAALAALVKGPFGLLPLLATGVAVAWEERSLRWALASAGLTVLAAVPVASFLLADKVWGTGSWWRGYVDVQLLASAVGERSDGLEPVWFPFATVAGRFWPGLPLVFLGCLRAAGWPRTLDRTRPPTPRVARRLALAALLVLFGLCLPGRKVWHHALVAYPLLALLAGAGAAPLLQKLLSTEARRRLAVGSLAVLAALCLGFLALRGGAWVWRPCVLAAEFSPALDGLAPGDSLLLVSNPTHWRMVAGLAAERQLEPVLERQLTAGTGAAARLALVEAHLFSPAGIPPEWQLEAQARGWVLLRRR